MSESTTKLEAELQAHKYGLRRTIDELGEATRSATDWRTQYRAHTGPMLAGAAVAGLAIGVATGWNRNSGGDWRDDDHEDVDVRPVRRSNRRKPAKQRAGLLAGLLSKRLAALLVNELRAYVTDRLVARRDIRPTDVRQHGVRHRSEARRQASS